jgi:hypothetical protein
MQRCRLLGIRRAHQTEAPKRIRDDPCEGRSTPSTGPTNDRPPTQGDILPPNPLDHDRAKPGPPLPSTDPDSTAHRWSRITSPDRRTRPSRLVSSHYRIDRIPGRGKLGQIGRTNRSKPERLR